MPDKKNSNYETEESKKNKKQRAQIVREKPSSKTNYTKNKQTTENKLLGTVVSLFFIGEVKITVS